MPFVRSLFAALDNLMGTTGISRFESFLFLGILQLQEISLLTNTEFQWPARNKLIPRALFDFFSIFNCNSFINYLNPATGMSFIPILILIAAGIIYFTLFKLVNQYTSVDSSKPQGDINRSKWHAACYILSIICKTYPYIIAIPLYQALIKYLIHSPYQPLIIVTIIIVAPIAFLFGFVTQENVRSISNYLTKPATGLPLLSSLYYIAILSVANCWKSNYDRLIVAIPVLVWQLLHYWIWITRDGFYRSNVRSFRGICLSLQIALSIYILADVVVYKVNQTNIDDISFIVIITFSTKVFYMIYCYYRRRLLEDGIDANNARRAEQFAKDVLDMINLLEYREHYTELRYIPIDDFEEKTLLHPAIIQSIFQTMFEEHIGLLRSTDMIYDPLNNQMLSINWKADIKKLLSHIPTNPMILKDVFKKVYLLFLEEFPKSWDLHLQFTSYLLQYLRHCPLASLKLEWLRRRFSKRNFFRKIWHLQQHFLLQKLTFMLIESNRKEQTSRENPETELVLDIPRVEAQYINYNLLMMRIKQHLELAVRFYEYLESKSTFNTEKTELLCDQLIQSSDQIRAFYNQNLRESLAATVCYYNFVKFAVNDLSEGDQIQDSFQDMRAYSKSQGASMQKVFEIDLLTNKNISILQVSGEMNTLGEILNILTVKQEFFQYQLHELIGENLTKLTPRLIRISHDMFMKNYIYYGKTNLLYRKRREFMVNKEGYIFPIGLMVKPIINSSTGTLSFSSFMQKIKNNHEYILTDKYGFIDSTSKLIATVLGLSPAALEENLIHSNQLFPELNKIFEPLPIPLSKPVTPGSHFKREAAEKERRLITLKIVVRKNVKDYVLQTVKTKNLYSFYQELQEGSLKVDKTHLSLLFSRKSNDMIFNPKKRNSAIRNERTYKISASLDVIHCPEPYKKMHIIKLYHVGELQKTINKELSEIQEVSKVESNMDPSKSETAKDTKDSQLNMIHTSKSLSQPQKDSTNSGINQQAPNSPVVQYPKGSSLDYLRAEQEVKFDIQVHGAKSSKVLDPESFKEMGKISKENLDFTASFQKSGSVTDNRLLKLASRIESGSHPSSLKQTEPTHSKAALDGQVSFSMVPIDKPIDKARIQSPDPHLHKEGEPQTDSSASDSKFKTSLPDLNETALELPKFPNTIIPKMITYVDQKKANISQKLPSAWELALKSMDRSIDCKSPGFGDSPVNFKRSQDNQEDLSQIEFTQNQSLEKSNTKNQIGELSIIKSMSRSNVSKSRSRSNKRNNTTSFLRPEGALDPSIRINNLGSERQISFMGSSRNFLDNSFRSVLNDGEDDRQSNKTNSRIISPERRKRIVARAQKIRTNLLMVERINSNTTFWNGSAVHEEDSKGSKEEEEPETPNAKRGEFSSSDDDEQEEEHEDNKPQKKVSQENFKKTYSQGAGDVDQAKEELKMVPDQKIDEEEDEDELKNASDTKRLLEHQEQASDISSARAEKGESFQKISSGLDVMKKSKENPNRPSRKLNKYENKIQKIKSNQIELDRAQMMEKIKIKHDEKRLQACFLQLKRSNWLVAVWTSLLLVMLSILAFAIATVLVEQRNLELYRQNAQHIFVTANMSYGITSLRNNLLDYLALNLSGGGSASSEQNDFIHEAQRFQASRLAFALDDITRDSPSSIFIAFASSYNAILSVAASNIISNFDSQTIEVLNYTETISSNAAIEASNYLSDFLSALTEKFDSLQVERWALLLGYCLFVILSTLIYLLIIKHTLRILRERFQWLREFSDEDIKDMKEAIINLQHHFGFKLSSKIEEYYSRAKSQSSVQFKMHAKKLKRSNFICLPFWGALTAIVTYVVSYAEIDSLFATLNAIRDDNLLFYSSEPTDLMSEIVDYKNYRFNPPSDGLIQELEQNLEVFEQNYQLSRSTITRVIIGGQNSVYWTVLNESICDVGPTCTLWNETRIGLTYDLTAKLNLSGLDASEFSNLTRAVRLINSVPLQLMSVSMEHITSAANYSFKVVLGWNIAGLLIAEIIILCLWYHSFYRLKQKFECSAKVLFFFPASSIFSKKNILKQLDFHHYLMKQRRKLALDF